MRIVLAGHVARIGKGRNSYRILMGKSEGKRRLRALKKQVGRVWTELIQLMYEAVGWLL
jgi:hypothetical protein